MTEYDELVKALRGCVLSKPCEGCPYYDPNGPTEKCATLNIAAADAIEELSAFREHITDGHFYCMRDGVLYEAKVELPKGKVFQLPPIVFVEEGE